MVGGFSWTFSKAKVIHDRKNVPELVNGPFVIFNKPYIIVNVCGVSFVVQYILLENRGMACLC